jgi:hypothetical protein
MPIRNEFVVLSTNNKKVITWHEWIATLPEDEQAKFRRAESRQVKHRQNAIDRGDMIIDPVTKDYVWRDSETAKKGKLTDGVWLDFWHRYVAECNIQFESVFKEE